MGPDKRTKHRKVTPYLDNKCGEARKQQEPHPLCHSCWFVRATEQPHQEA